MSFRAVVTIAIHLQIGFKLQVMHVINYLLSESSSSQYCVQTYHWMVQCQTVLSSNPKEQNTIYAFMG